MFRTHIRLGRSRASFSGALGCISSIAIFLLVIGCIVGLAAVIMGSMRSSEVVQQAMRQLESNSQAVRALGEPIKLGWVITGSMSTSGESGDASLSLPVSGSRDRGTVTLIAYKSGGEWRFNQLVLTTKTYVNRINLLEE